MARVKWFNMVSGYGFLLDLDTKKEIFVHHSELKVKNDCFRFLMEGEYVEYEEGKTNSEKHEIQAVNVTGIKGNELICETEHSSKTIPQVARKKMGRVNRGDGGGPSAAAPKVGAAESKCPCVDDNECCGTDEDGFKTVSSRKRK